MDTKVEFPHALVGLLHVTQPKIKTAIETLPHEMPTRRRKPSVAVEIAAAAPAEMGVAARGTPTRSREAVEMPAERGFTADVGNGGKHIKVRCYDQGRRYVLIVPRSPGDYRATATHVQRFAACRGELTEVDSMLNRCTGQCGRHRYLDRGHDFYQTPERATNALLDVVDLSRRTIWEPCTGNGAMVRPMRDRCIAVICSDIVQRDFPLHFVGDFFAQTAAPGGCSIVATNAPFRLSAPFVRHALTLVREIIIFEKLTFFESARRADLFRPGGGLFAIYAFAHRLPMIHRESWTGTGEIGRSVFAPRCVPSRAFPNVIRNL